MIFGLRISKIYKPFYINYNVMKKRGMSEVVTTVLIILIVIAAVAIIWAAIRPAIQSAGEQVTADCFTTSFEVVSCTGNIVTVKRNAGGSTDAVAYRVTVGNQILEGTSLDALQQGTVTALAATPITAGQIANVGANINGKICEPVGTPVNCT